MASFREFIKIKALEDRLPFGLDFEIQPSFPDQPTEYVAGFKIPRFDELLTREAWFFEVIGSANANRRNDLQFRLRSLATDLKKRCPSLKTLSLALSALFNPSEELANSLEYEEFLSENNDTINKLIELSNLLENDLALNWIKITFFLASRLDGNWDMSNTAALRKSQTTELLNFILRETNGGTIPEDLVVEAGDEGDREEDEVVAAPPKLLEGGGI